MSRVHAALAGVEELLDLLLGQVFQASLGCNAGIDHVGRDDGGFHGRPYGKISMGILSCVRIQTSTMSELDRAMQPSVQSVPS